VTRCSLRALGRLGNVIDPKLVIDGGKNQKTEPAFGADTLRLWVSTVDYTGDVRVGNNILKQVSDNYRKIRNTLRYIIGNLHDFSPTTDTVDYADLPELDRWMLGRLGEVQAEVKDAFETFQFYRASQAITAFCITDLSNFYLDVAKDRLYISAAGEARRRSCQTVLKVVLETLLSAIAPILPHMAEDAWQNLPWDAPSTSVFQAGWTDIDFAPRRAQEWEAVRAFRDDVNKCMDAARVDKLVGASLDARVVVHCSDPELKATLQGLKPDGSMLATSGTSVNGVDDIRFLLLSSEVTFVDSADDVAAACDAKHIIQAADTESGVVVGVAKADGDKCERCWFFSASVGTHDGLHNVCPRCAAAVKAGGGLQEPAATG